MVTAHRTTPVALSHQALTAKVVTVESSAKTVKIPVRVPQSESKAKVPVVASKAPVPKPIVLDEHEQWMQAADIPKASWSAVDYIVSHESGWCPTKWEGEYGTCPAYHGVPSYGGYGLCQSTPPQKMASAGSDWKTNPITQLKWCSMHATADYGSWWSSFAYWSVHRNW